MRSIRGDCASVMHNIRNDGLGSIGGVLLGVIAILYAFGCARPQEYPDTLTFDLGGGVTMELVKIPAGHFQMGTVATDKDWLSASRPVHKVTFAKPFYMGKYEVTQAQWRAVMGTAPSHFSGDDHPVEQVSWDDAVAFCEALSTKVGRAIRLPSEAEWEYACKADSGDTSYFFGDVFAELGDYGWYWANDGGETHPVGEKKPNDWGLYDTHGNVFEWCQDWWNDDYDANDDGVSDAPTDGSVWTTVDSTKRVLRGGCWGYIVGDCRSAYRVGILPGYRLYCLGFRVAADTQ